VYVSLNVLSSPEPIRTLKQAHYIREKDLDEVLQISNVFMNVSKGEVAKSNDLKKSFGTDERYTIAREVSDILLSLPHTTDSLELSLPSAQILSKGEVQVGEKEREHDTAAVRREIATLVAEKCVDPATQTPYSVSIIEKAMTEAGYSVRANKNAKSQVRLEIGPSSLLCMHDYTHAWHVRIQGVRVYQSTSIGLHTPHPAC
jgi:ribosome maturation protein Sdo1